MLRVAVFVMLVVLVCGDDFSDLFPNQTIQFTNPDSTTFIYYRAFYSEGGSIVNCTHSTNDSSVTVIFTCGSTSNNITAYFSDRSLCDDDIIGGAGVKYTFQCAPLSDHNVTLLGNLTAVSVNHTVESSDPLYAITANFSDEEPVTTATVGEYLEFRINGPREYSMKHLLCVATGGGNTKTLITDGCSNDDTLVWDFTNKSTFHETAYIMPFFTFKFFDTVTLDLECTVKTCSSVAPKRRALSSNEADDDSAEIASFTKRLIIKGVILGGSTRANGSVGLTLALSMMFALMKV